ncbi:hypothetical protein ACCO45_005023 [Purpureocillium lilacinum]|uniref:Uncharacterized protein n=1 Tax=Purpureocillium lilacinum TaxID=33203 RepID=A0ACC4DWW3_PURLI
MGGGISLPARQGKGRAVENAASMLPAFSPSRSPVARRRPLFGSCSVRALQAKRAGGAGWVAALEAWPRAHPTSHPNKPPPAKSAPQPTSEWHVPLAKASQERKAGVLSLASARRTNGRIVPRAGPLLLLLRAGWQSRLPRVKIFSSRVEVRCLRWKILPAQGAATSKPTGSGAAPHAQWKEGRYPPGAPAAADDACAAAQSCPQTVRPDPEPEPRPLPSPAQMECFKTLARPCLAKGSSKPACESMPLANDVLAMPLPRQ